MSDHYDRDGHPITMDEWARLFEDQDYQRVALDENETVRVSTVWLGLNHRFLGDGPPLIFETMVFGTGAEDEPCWRWSTEAEARAGHAEIASAMLRGRQRS